MGVALSSPPLRQPGFWRLSYASGSFDTSVRKRTSTCPFEGRTLCGWRLRVAGPASSRARLRAWLTTIRRRSAAGWPSFQCPKRFLSARPTRSCGAAGAQTTGNVGSSSHVPSVPPLAAGTPVRPAVTCADCSVAAERPQGGREGGAGGRDGSGGEHRPRRAARRSQAQPGAGPRRGARSPRPGSAAGPHSAHRPEPRSRISVNVRRSASGSAPGETTARTSRTGYTRTRRRRARRAGGPGARRSPRATLPARRRPRRHA
jgi:hypothetical protein